MRALSALSGRSLLILPLALALACGGAVAPESVPAAASSSPGTSGGGGGGTAAGGTAGGVAAPGGAEPPVHGTVGPGTACGGRGNVMPCAADEYCAFPVNKSGYGHCGGDDVAGKCLPKPTACTDEYAPVCGCDSKTYENLCAAATAGVSVKKSTPCADFACGDTSCDATTSYCSISADNTGASCIPLPLGCEYSLATTPTCDCFQLDLDPCVGCAPTCKRILVDGAVAAFTLTAPP